MSTRPHTSSPSDRARARQFIDDVININRKYGMGSVTSEKALDSAVADASRGLSRARGASRKGPRSQ